MRYRILVIDDDTAIQRALERELEVRFEVVLAPTGEEGLRALQGSEPFAAVVCDFQLGSGIDGVAVLQAVREMAPSCVRVLASGVFLGALPTAASGGLAYAVIAKPWERGAIRAALEGALSTEAGDGQRFADGLVPDNG